MPNYKKKWENVRYRIATIASCFGNAIFFGAPVIEALMPDFSEAIIYANGYARIRLITVAIKPNQIELSITSLYLPISLIYSNNLIQILRDNNYHLHRNMRSFRPLLLQGLQGQYTGLYRNLAHRLEMHILHASHHLFLFL